MNIFDFNHIIYETNINVNKNGQINNIYNLPIFIKIIFINF